jgi:hypothetical protein
MANSSEFSGVSTVWGDKRVAIGKIILTGIASGSAYIPGLSYIENVSVSINRHTETTSYSVIPNTGSASTSIEGMLHIGSAVAGDSFTVIAWGR